MSRELHLIAGANFFVLKQDSWHNLDVLTSYSLIRGMDINVIYLYGCTPEEAKNNPDWVDATGKPHLPATGH